MSRKESRITPLWKWSSYATCSSHPSTKRECSRAQIHERHSLLDYPQSTVLRLPFPPFWSNNAFCWEHSWLWLIPAGFLAEACGWLSDHVYVTGYLGQITWDCFAWPVYKQHILLLPQQNKPDQSVVRNLRRCREEDQGNMLLDEGSISLLANCILADMWFQPVSRMQPGWPALSAQHITGNRPHLMWHGWHRLESCEGDPADD